MRDTTLRLAYLLGWLIERALIARHLHEINRELKRIDAIERALPQARQIELDKRAAGEDRLRAAQDAIAALRGASPST